MYKLFKKRKEEKKKKKLESDNANVDATNAEQPVEEITAGASALSLEPANNSVMNLNVERKPSEETEVAGRPNNMHLCVKQAESVINKDKVIRREAPPQRQQTNRGITPDALRVLEAVGMTHTAAKKTFYLARTVSKNEPVHDHIIEYVRNSQVHGYGLKVKNIVRLVRDGEREFQHDSERNQQNRLLLWHGTKLQAVAPILEKGFLLPKPNGQMFGPGIYFADRVSKSTNYCDTDRKPGTKVYLLLCDVLLGNVYNARNAHTEFTKAPDNTTRTFNSVKCTGKRIPDPLLQRDFNGSKIPCGTTVQNTRFEEYTVAYNEFIVYSTENIRIVFLIEVEFADEPVLDLERGETAVNKDLVTQKYR